MVIGQVRAGSNGVVKPVERILAFESLVVWEFNGEVGAERGELEVERGGGLHAEHKRERRFWVLSMGAA